METERIKQLLERYFEGESTAAEEAQLYAYFSSGEVDAELLPYCELFGALDELQSRPNEKLEEELMDFILENEHREKNKLRYLWQSISAVAAVLIIALLIFNYQQDRTTWKDTYTNPNEAYAEAARTLQFVGTKYRQGMAQLQPLQKYKQAIQPLNSGLSTLNKGFEEMDNLKEVNKKLNPQ